jgi:hypothetical protein
MLEPHLEEKNHQEEAKLDILNPQHTQSFSTPHYTEKPGGLLCHQMLVPNLAGRCRPTCEKISSTRYSHSLLG